MTDWSTALDQFEARLEEFGSVLGDDGRPAKGLWPPPDLIGIPLPPELAERAQSLLDRARELEGKLVARKAELPARRQAVRHRRRSTPTVYTEL